MIYVKNILHQIQKEIIKLSDIFNMQQKKLRDPML